MLLFKDYSCLDNKACISYQIHCKLLPGKGPEILTYEAQFAHLKNRHTILLRQ